MTLAHERRGDGPPLILLHGLGSRREIWRPLLERLARRHEAIAVDLPGFGESPPLPGGVRPDPDTLADSVVAFAEHLGLRDPDVAGHSLGGWVALELGRRRHARSVTAFAPAGFWNAREARFADCTMAAARVALSTLRPLERVVGANRPLRTALLSQYFAQPWQLRVEDARLAVRGYADAPALPPARRALFAGRFPAASAVAVATTIVWGSRDLLLLPRQARRAAARLPGARSVMLRGRGHVPFWEAPAVCAELIEETTATGSPTWS